MASLRQVVLAYHRCKHSVVPKLRNSRFSLQPPTVSHTQTFSALTLFCLFVWVFICTDLSCYPPPAQHVGAQFFLKEF